MKKKRAVFLDRDGTINEDKGYLYRIEDFVYLDGVLDALKLFHKMGFLIVIITNQSGIARGYYTEKDMEKLHKWMVEDLAEKGAPVAGLYYCPHYPESKIEKYKKTCQCRKPGTALFKRAAEELQIEMEKSYAIGDKIRDLKICQEYNIQGILLGDDSREVMEISPIKDIWICENWREVVEKMQKVNNCCR